MCEWRLGKIRIREKEQRPLTIISDAALASVGIREGKLTPLIVIDVTERPDIVELVRVHQYLPPGDVMCQWGKLPGTKNKVALLLKFIRPSEINIILEFDITKQHGLIDHIIQSGGLYIQPGYPGDCLATTADKPKIIIQVPDTGFRPTWEKLFRKSLIENFRRQGALNKQSAQHLAEAFIKEWRQFGNFRMTL